MKIRVFYHDKCFDGACSAALFSRFYRERIREHAEFEYVGLVHRAGSLFNEADFTGDENAIVDFKYSPSPRITWWFDHHQSAFLTPEDASHFEQDTSNTKFYDPDYRSCTKFIAEVTKERFGFNPDPVAEVVEWADIIDGALYSDPQTAVEMAEPAMKLTMVIESNQDPGFIPKLIGMLAYQPLAEIIGSPEIAETDSGPDGAASQVDRDPARSHGMQRWDGLLRRYGPRTRGLQQVHSVLPEPKLYLQRGAEQEQLPDEGIGRVESLGAS